MKTAKAILTGLAVLLLPALVLPPANARGMQGSKPPPAKTAAAAKPAFTSDALDQLLAPIALYPDQLLAQVLLSSTDLARLRELDAWLKTKPPFKGTALEEAAKQTGFEPSLVALSLFPQVVEFMVKESNWTTQLGQAFSADRNGVMDSIQRLRAKSRENGTLKSTPQQTVSTVATDTGQQVIVIEPANPQIIYVPQYNPQVVYSNTVVVQQESNNDSAAVAAGVVGFAAGIAIGAAIDNDYYYGPYGWHGAPYMYGGAWDDYYDDREDAREDWYDNREDAREDLADHREDMAGERSERAGTQQQERTERQQTRQETRPATQSQRQQGTSGVQATAQQSGRTTASTAETRGQNRDRSQTSVDRSGTKSDAFSGYSSGRSERSASSRGQRSRSSSGGRGRR
jgi:hypothetical protein